MNTKVVAYYRRSTNLQENSINMQQQMAFEKAIKHSLPIDEEYIDDAISARKVNKNNRKRLDQLLNEIKEDRIHTLFVYKRDRLARNSLEYLEIYSLFKEKNLNVVFTCDSEIPIQYNHVGELLECIMAGIIQREGEQIVQRIIETIKANFNSGKNTGPLPYGYDYDKNKKAFTKIPTQVDNIKTIYTELLDEKYNSLTELRKELDLKGLKKDGKSFTNQSIKKILKDPTYMGLRKMNIDNTPLERRFSELKIVDEDDWYKAQQILERISPTNTREPIPDQDFLLQGKLTCYLCNKLLDGKGSRVKNTLVFKYKCKEHHQINVDKEEVEEKALYQCFQFFDKLLDSNLDSLYKRFRNQYEKNVDQLVLASDQKVNELYNQLNKITENWFYEKRQDKKDKLEVRMLNLYDKIKQQKQLRDALLDEVAEIENLPLVVKNIDESFKLSIHKLPYKLKTQFLKDVIHEVIVKPNTIKIIFKHPFLESREVVS